MIRQIVQIFHNIIGKGIKPDNDHQINPADSATQDRTVAVKAVDQKTFDNIVNESIDCNPGQGCLLIGDVDRCRDINNIYGHDAGDAVLRYAASVLCDVFRDCVYIGDGGDMFTLWLRTVLYDSADDIRRAVGVVNDRLLHPSGEIPPSSLSVGAAFCKPGDDCRSLAKKAYKALCLVKENGRCGCEMSL